MAYKPHVIYIQVLDILYWKHIKLQGCWTWPAVNVFQEWIVSATTSRRWLASDQACTGGCAGSLSAPASSWWVERFETLQGGNDRERNNGYNQYLSSQIRSFAMFSMHIDSEITDFLTLTLCLTVQLLIQVNYTCFRFFPQNLLTSTPLVGFTTSRLCLVHSFHDLHLYFSDL